MPHLVWLQLTDHVLEELAVDSRKQLTEQLSHLVGLWTVRSCTVAQNQMSWSTRHQVVLHIQF